jgi:hypothetical protein
MSRLRTVRLPHAIDSAFEILCQRVRALYRSSNAAAVGIFVWACCHHHKRHRFGAEIAAMPARDRDLIYEFILHCVRENHPCSDHLPTKPARACDLLAMARRWKLEGKLPG